MKRCLECTHFAEWDGDFVCCEYFKILSGENEHGQPLDLENIIKERECEGYEEETWEPRLQLNRASLNLKEYDTGYFDELV